jgi:YD repeat-containing protein
VHKSVYNDAGRLSKTTDSTTEDTTYHYDDAGFLKTVLNPNHNTVGCTYDKRGNKLTETTAAGTTTNTYDQRDRLVTSLSPGGNLTRTVYDAAGEVASTTDARNKTTNDTYDGAGRLATATDPDHRLTKGSYTTDGRLEPSSTPTTPKSRTCTTTTAPSIEQNSQQPAGCDHQRSLTHPRFTPVK